MQKAAILGGRSMRYNRRAIMKYAHLLAEMEGFDMPEALTRTWKDARELYEQVTSGRHWVTPSGDIRYVCSFELVMAPGVQWVTPDQSWNESHDADDNYINPPR